MKLLMFQICLIIILLVNGDEIPLTAQQNTEELFFQLPITEFHKQSRTNQTIPQIDTINDNYSHTVYQLFGNKGSGKNQVIYAPGLSAFIRPSQFIKHERNEVTSQTSEFKTTLGNMESKLVHSTEVTKSHSTPVFDPSTVKSFGLPDGNMIGNLFNLAENINDNTNFPSIETQTNQELMLPIDSGPDSSSQWVQIIDEISNQRNDWKDSFEKRKWLQELEEARRKPTTLIQQHQDNSPEKINHEIVQQRNDLGFIGAYTADAAQAQEDKQLIDMITQGLHPLQEHVVDNPKPRTNSDGAEEEEISQVPGLHFLQEFSKSDNKEIINFNTDSRNPIGFNVREPSTSEVMSSVNYLRPKSRIKRLQLIERPLIGIDSIPDNANLERNQIVVRQPSLTTNLQISPMDIATTDIVPQANSSIFLPKMSTNSFGLRHGINNHHNIWNYFSKSKLPIKDAAIISFQNEPSLSESMTKTPVSTQLPVSNNLKKMNWIYPDIKNIPDYTATEGPLLRDKFPVDMNSLPSLELTSQYLPVATFTSSYPRNVGIKFKTAVLPNGFQSQRVQTMPMSPWVSNILLPTMSLNSLTEKNVRETSRFVNMHGRLVDRVTETTSTHQFNLTHQFKPLVSALLGSPLTLRQKMSPKSVPLLVSRSRSVPQVEPSENQQRANRSGLNPNTVPTNISRRKQRLLQSVRRNLQPQKQRWGLSQRSIVPVNL